MNHRLELIQFLEDTFGPFFKAERQGKLYYLQLTSWMKLTFLLKERLLYQKVVLDAVAHLYF